MPPRSDSDSPRASATTPSTSKPPRLTAAQVGGEVSRIAKTVEWSLAVPGRHYSGLAYDELLDVLEAQGRDFRRDTSALRRAALAETQMRLAKLGRAPTWAEFREAYALAVLGFVVKRFEGKVRDVPLRRLTIPYAKAKKAAGYGDRPIGVRTGALSLRVAEFGDVKVRR